MESFLIPPTSHIARMKRPKISQGYPWSWPDVWFGLQHPPTWGYRKSVSAQKGLFLAIFFERNMFLDKIWQNRPPPYHMYSETMEYQLQDEPSEQPVRRQNFAKMWNKLCTRDLTCCPMCSSPLFLATYATCSHSERNSFWQMRVCQQIFPSTAMNVRKYPKKLFRI